MSYIFENSATLFSFRGAKPVTIAYEIQGDSSPTRSESLITTSIQVDQAPNLVVQQSLDQTPYIYSFGQKPGRILLSGFAFEACDVGQQSTRSGLVELSQFYKDSCEAVDSGGDAPLITVNIWPSDESHLAVINQFTYHVTAGQEKAPGMIAWSLSLTLLPPSLGVELLDETAAESDDDLADPDLDPDAGDYLNG